MNAITKQKSKQERTPGPWTYAGRLGFGHLIDPNIAVAYGGEGSGRTDQGEANARLISAAPDLLVALKEAVAFHDGEDNETLASWRAAIAKAEGR
ncbi:hypothetical protein C7441_112133 [Pseudaminobacter salicylatoxidans]|uniref:Uncharacterized protein n=1 Tax=Pseudaminobacter salicylatoxidans TaxID=93369 RepID=A0A316C1K5_PSESE|nr:hypothetical protein [Pseudaminobacter salicylatoxidans]PWJ80591.1 hypothetical protein C7441_112133 [Pseudaminobacter salicylatoxidans]